MGAMVRYACGTPFGAPAPVIDTPTRSGAYSAGGRATRFIR